MRTTPIATWGLRAAIAVCAMIAMAPRPGRDEASFLEVKVTGGERVPGTGIVTLSVVATNTHPQRRRVNVEWLDVSESLGRAGLVVATNRTDPARWVPLARTWRIPFEEGIAAKSASSRAVRILDAKPGHYEGWIDVVLDGTTWVRTPVSFDVAEARQPRSQGGSEQSR